MKHFLRAAYLKNINMPILVFLSVLFNILILSNILQSDYFGDDLYNFQISGKVPYEYMTITSYTYEAIVGWMKNGRFFPIAVAYLYYVFDWFDSIYSYKMLMLVVTVTSNLLFSLFIYLFSKNKHISLLVLLITPILFQYRFYHDPILSFHGLMPLLFSFFIVSLIFLLKHLENGNKLHLTASFLFFSACLLTYEISYTFLLIYMLIVSSQISIKTHIKRYFMVLSPYFFVLVLFTVFTLYLRDLTSMDGGPYSLSWDVVAILKTYYFQTISVLPTTYYINFGHKVHMHDIEIMHITLSLLLFFYIYISALRLKGFESQEYKSLIVLAVLIMLLPGLLISLSIKFQGTLGEMNKVQFGLAYIPIYIQTFGLSLLLSVLINKASSVKRNLFVLAGLALILTIHMVSNKQVIDKVNSPYKNNREVLTLFLSGDFKDRLHSGDVIKIIGESPFHSKDFVSMVTGKNIKVAVDDGDSYNYRIQYETSGNSAIINIQNNLSGKEFISIYKKIEGNWEEQYNELGSNIRNIDSIPPIFNNFYPWEGVAGKFRWAKPNPSILWINPSNAIKSQKLVFKIRSLNARNVTINLNKNKLYGFALAPNVAQIVEKNMNLHPGKNIIEFVTKEKPVNPDGPDDRSLLFSIESIDD